MKTKSTIAAILLAAGMFAQTKPSIAVLNIDSKGVINTSEEMGYLVRLEIEKTDKYSVMDKYEVGEVVKANNIDLNTCYSKSCLVNAGKALKVEKMLSGSVERFEEKVIVSLRIIDVASGIIEKNETTEFLNLPEIQKMIRISVEKIVGIEPNPMLVKLLIDYDVPVESPKNTLRLNGPRMGFSSTLGKAGEILTSPTAKGGFDMFPVNFQFGWQQEVQYISSGNFQALIENIFLIGGLESGKVLPSYTPLLGFRFGKGAWEFGFGPTFRLIKKANGFYDTENYLGGGKNEWYLENQWNTKADSVIGKPAINPYSIESRLDSRGNTELSTGLVIAIGKTFRSGYLNIPVNVYVAPRKDGTAVGAMIGFNIQKKKRVQ